MKSRAVLSGFMAPLHSGHARRRVGAIASADPFVEWFNRAAFDLQSKTRRAWPAFLAGVMDENGDPTDRTYLRRVARGERLPGLKKAYSIGEGFRLAGLAWCSGTMAIYQHDAYRRDAYALLDIASRSGKTARIVADWLHAVTLVGTYEVRASETREPQLDEQLERDLQLERKLRSEFVESWRQQLGELSKTLAKPLDAAWASYECNGIGKIYGPLGGMHLVQTLPEFAPVAEHFTRILEDDLRQTLIKHKTMRELFPNDFHGENADRTFEEFLAGVSAAENRRDRVTKG